SRKMFRTHDSIIGNHPYFWTAARCRLDAIWISNAAARSDQIEQRLEVLAASENENSVQPTGRECAQSLGCILFGGINDRVSAKFFHQLFGCAAACRPDHACPMSFRELHRERSDCSTRPEDQDGGAASHPQMIVNSLQGS